MAKAKSNGVARMARERIAELEVELSRWRRVIELAGEEPPQPLAIPPTPTIDEVIALVATRYGVEPAKILSDSRAQPETTARQIAMRLARELTGKSYPEIGRAFGKDHTTVIHALDATEGFALGDMREDLMAVVR